MCRPPIRQCDTDVHAVAWAALNQTRCDGRAGEPIDLFQQRTENPAAVERGQRAAGLGANGDRALSGVPCPQRSTCGRDGGVCGKLRHCRMWHPESGAGDKRFGGAKSSLGAYSGGDGGAGKRRSAYPAHIRSSHGVDLREHVLDIDQLVESEELISRRAGARGRRLCGHGELSCSDGPGAREFCFRRAIGG